MFSVHMMSCVTMTWYHCHCVLQFGAGREKGAEFGELKPDHASTVREPEDHQAKFMTNRKFIEPSKGWPGALLLPVCCTKPPTKTPEQAEIQSDSQISCVPQKFGQKQSTIKCTARFKVIVL